MKGRRLPLGTWPTEPGDYMGPISGYSGVPAISRSIHHVTCPPHTYRECPDGSLEIRASLGDMHRSHDGEKLVEVSDGWHGYLDEGARGTIGDEGNEQIRTAT